VKTGWIILKDMTKQTEISYWSDFFFCVFSCGIPVGWLRTRYFCLHCVDLLALLFFYLGRKKVAWR